MSRLAAPALALALTSLAAPGCIIIDLGDTDGPALQRGDEADPILVTRACQGAPKDTLQLTATTLSPVGGTLRATVGYGGGCKEHFFTACWNGLVRESHPAQLDLVLRHEANNDACDAFVTRDLVIDLASLPMPIGGASVADPAGVIVLTTP